MKVAKRLLILASLSAIGCIVAFVLLSRGSLTYRATTYPLPMKLNNPWVQWLEGDAMVLAEIDATPKTWKWELRTASVRPLSPNRPTNSWDGWLCSPDGKWLIDLLGKSNAVLIRSADEKSRAETFTDVLQFGGVVWQWVHRSSLWGEITDSPERGTRFLSTNGRVVKSLGAAPDLQRWWIDAVVAPNRIIASDRGQFANLGNRFYWYELGAAGVKPRLLREIPPPPGLSAGSIALSPAGDRLLWTGAVTKSLKSGKPGLLDRVLRLFRFRNDAWTVQLWLTDLDGAHPELLGSMQAGSSIIGQSGPLTNSGPVNAAFTLDGKNISFLLEDTLHIVPIEGL